MKTLLVTASLLIMSSLALSQNTPSSNDECRVRGNFNIEFNKFYPSIDAYNHANVENFTSLGINGNMAKFYFGQFNVSHQVGFNWGQEHYTDLIKDIEFEGDYTGGYTATSSRAELYAMSKIGYQPFNKVEFNVYAGFSARRMRTFGEYFLYPGQTIAAEDQVSDGEADEANTNTITKKWNAGLKGAFEVSLFPNHNVSPFFKMSYQQYGQRDVYSLPDARINTTSGDVYMPFTSVNNTSDWGFAIGVRLNIKTGCPRTPSKSNSSSNSNSNSNKSKSDRNDNNNSSGGGSGGKVVLKPKVRKR